MIKTSTNCMTEKETVAYKAFNNSFQGYGGYQYAVGETYEFDGEPIPCRQGFHACLHIIDCLDYYHIFNTTRFAKVTIFGDYVKDGNKICAKKIRIDEELDKYQAFSGELLSHNGKIYYYINEKVSKDEYEIRKQQKNNFTIMQLILVSLLIVPNLAKAFCGIRN